MNKPDPQAKHTINQAVNAMRAGKPEQAETTCLDYLSANPASIPHLQLLSHALMHQQRLSEAREQVEFGLKIAPDFAPLHEDLGSINGLAGDHEAAINSLKRAVQIDPSLATAHKKLAHALMKAGRNAEIDEAMEDYFDHDEEAALVAAGAEHWRAERDEDAEAVLRSALRKYPNNVNAMRFLAKVYQRQGKKMDDAEALLRKATSIAPDFHQALNNLGRILVDNGKWEDAVSVYRKLVKLTPEDDDAWAGMGRALAHSGDVAAAADAYQRSLALRPESATVNMALAHMLKTLGRQADALDAYRRSISYKPGLGESYWSMANLKIFRFQPEEVDAMEGQLATAEISDVGRVNFHFALGKAYEDRQDYDLAWKHYHRGNELQRMRVDYDAVENEVHLKQIRNVFSRDFMNNHTDAGHTAPDPIFIVGLPRSGSTLIEQILASHSQVEGTAELPNLASIATGTGKYRHDGLIYPATAGSLTSRDFTAYGKEYLAQVANHRTQATPFFIDKMPNNFVHVGWIKLTLPNAKIINTRRHPIDSCLGAYKQLFAKGQHFTYDMLELAEFYRCYVDIMEHWHSVAPGAVLDVHYEDTVTDLEGQVRRILDFCGLPFEEQCLRYHETERAVKTASSEQVRQPIYTDALGLWKKYGEHLEEWQDELGDIISALPETVRAAAS